MTADMIDRSQRMPPANELRDDGGGGHPPPHIGFQG